VKAQLHNGWSVLLLLLSPHFIVNDNFMISRESVKLQKGKTVPLTEECFVLACLKSIVSRVKWVVSGLKRDLSSSKQAFVFFLSDGFWVLDRIL
jgi:hypothetical protein